jgi:PAS domain S-box-containing protein
MTHTETPFDDAEERLGQIISFLPDPTFVVDRRGTVIAWNRAMERLTGHPADEVIGRDDHAYALPIYGERRPMLIDVALGHTEAEALYEGMERDGETVTAEVHVSALRPGGAILWCKAGPLRNADGQIVGAIESVRDVTDQRRAQEALRRSEDEKRAILDATPEFVVLHDADQRIVWTNASAAEAAGVPREDLIGRHCWEFWGHAHRACPGCPVAKALETGEMHEQEQTTPDGREWFVRGTPLLGPDGQVTGAVEMARDVTDRKRRIKTLRDSEAKYRLLAENQRDVVVALTPDGTLTYCSPAVEEFGGYHPDEEIGQRITKYIVGDEDKQRAMAVVAQTVRDREPATVEFLYQPKEGEPFPAEATGKPVVEDGEVVSVQAVLRDITERKRAEERLAIFRRFAEASEQGFGMADLDGRATYINPALTRMLGLERDDELVGQSFLPCYPDEVQERLRSEILPAVRRGEPWQGELWFVDRHGRRVETYESFFLIHDDRGNPLCLADVITDITERKRTEERFRTLFEGSRDALMTLAPPSWRFTSGNPAALAMFGVEDEEAFTALGPWDISPETQPDGRPSDEKAREMLETVIREGAHFFEWTHLDADGEPFPATVLLTRMDVAGETVVQATVRDITQRKQAEHALRERIKELKGLNGLTQLAAETEADVDGYLRRAVRLLPPAWKHSDVATAEICLDGRCFRTDPDADCPRRQRAEIRVRGEARGYVEVGYTEERPEADEGPFLKEERTLINTMAWQLGVIIDRMESDQALAEQKAALERSNAELQEFAYVASHDLQEPLRMVSSYVQLLARRYEDCLDEDAQEFIGYAVDGANRMQTLINDLLQYSRVGTRGKPFAPTDGEEVMEDVLANLEVAVKEADAEVTYDDMPRVVADEGQLARVFQNLIGNALKFCDAAPRVHVSAERGEGAWRFHVRDNGIGIDPDQQEKVFVVFHRLHGRDQYAGTGMGLAITKKIVERHGGRIWVESEPGEGSTFTFTLPDRKESSDESEGSHGDRDPDTVACPSGGDSAG